MAWAEATAYSEAVQNPRVAFRDAELQSGELATNRMGLPLIHTGNFAAVFQMRCPAGPPDWALKCFTRQVHGLRRRYQATHTHLNGRRLPFMVQFAYQPDGILVQGQRYPLLKMDWVEGLRLDQFLADCLTRPGAKSVLRRLSQMWLKLSVMLREAEVGHGDLQHGNVMLVPVPGSDALALKLIDYDGMYVPKLAGHLPGEIGHPAYQHPGRSLVTGYGPEVDRFSQLVIYTTLQALLAGGRDLWQQFYNGDRLLLGPHDFRDPGNSEAFRTLWQIDKPEVRALTGHLVLAAVGPVESVPLLRDLVSDAGVTELTVEQQGRVGQMLGPVDRRPARKQRAVETSSASRPVSEPVIVTCACGQSFRAAAHLYGKQVACPVCGLSLDVPDPGLEAVELLGLEPLLEPEESFLDEMESFIPVASGSRLLPVMRSVPEDPPFDFREWMDEHRLEVWAGLIGIVGLLLVSLVVGLLWERSDPVERPLAGVEAEVVVAGVPAKPSPSSQASLPTITNSIGMVLVEIPAGEFLMGSPDSDREASADEKPQHRVRITEPFYLGICEVTQSQWERVMGSNPSRFKGADQPVENVSWADCQEFIRRLNGRAEERGGAYRLPTEAEWEYACRAGSTTVYSFGDSAWSLGDFAWYQSNSGSRTHAVSQKRPNAWGLYDMHGNVSEWCQDWHDSGYSRSSPRDDPQGPAGGSDRVVRGGSWFSFARNCRSADWRGSRPSLQIYNLGFRLARGSVE
jgi:formylglycine-generating enzyme required for sulfatase activity